MHPIMFHEKPDRSAPTAGAIAVVAPIAAYGVKVPPRRLANVKAVVYLHFALTVIQHKAFLNK
jgi:hypothetical protein